MKVLIVLCMIATLVVSLRAAPQQLSQPIAILRQAADASPDGTYTYSFETENSITAAEQGQLKAIRGDDPAVVAQGTYSYTAPDGEQISIQYIADENGFQPQGNAIPAIPEAIQKALAYNAAHPEEDNL